MSRRDLYQVLGVAKGASDEDIKKAYRKLAKELHPDRNSDDKSLEAKFKEVNAAYEVLRDPQKRAAYDQFGHAAFEGGMGGGPRPGAGPGGADFASAFSDVFDDLFGDFVGGRRGGPGNGQRRSRGSDLRYNLGITLEEAFAGKQTTITIPGSTTCAACEGTGSEGAAQPQTCPTCQGMGKVR
ncbi:DnaJ domain-containing protein, partial [Rubrimonas sp.]|uniref:DnaJ domain-containing protein n=1 Tax=Rubrimonas sp. TaxID=2036015 RepID=UPI002FDE0655